MAINGTNYLWYYDHPYNVTIINDNTVVEKPKTSIPNRINFLSIFTGGKGRDNKLLKKLTKSDFVKEYGRPDIIKYGQPILNAYASIVDSYSYSYCMRVMPLNACYSNIIVCAKYKVNDDGNFEVQIENKFAEGLNNQQQFQSMIDAHTKMEEDEEGFKCIPLFGLRSLGRGSYGNAYRIRLTNIFTRKEQAFRRYFLELLDVDEGNVVVESFEGCLYDYTSTTNVVSYLMSDVLDKDEAGSERVGIIVNEDAWDILYEEYKNCFKTADEKATLPERNQFDPIFGLANNKTAQPKLVISTAEDCVMDRLDGVPMMGGNNGDFDNPGDKTYEQIVEELYIKAFRGELDRSILSSRRTPVRFMLDANYPLAVKRELVALGLKRYDAMIYLDAGLITTHDEAIIFGEDTVDLNYRIVSKHYQHYEIRDPFTGKRVPVTMTYDLACNLAKHLETYGSDRAYAGETYATLKGAIKGSLVPVLDEYDEELKEKLYDLRLNYYEAIAENVFCRGIQQTAQDMESDLSEESNMIMLLEIKDIAERETISRRYNFAEPEDRRLYSEILTERIKPYKESVRSIEVFYDMSNAEEQRNFIHCYIQLTFKTLLKSSIIEINVNSRI